MPAGLTHTGAHGAKEHTVQIDINRSAATIQVTRGDTLVTACYIGRSTQYPPDDTADDWWSVTAAIWHRECRARAVPEACGAVEHLERLQVRHCMRLAVAETDDPAAAMGEAGPA
jgi:uncharacterized protein (DUF2237 family)